eukprot:NODE_11839_length_1262_cov_5.769163.p1 GENE.NODE_11839_length_1262_cov_5.769163~~NODE_11839_length_1262_cov_5.769163.p1  ORF type:complete len:194 (-),score=44.41 NODE_11839_length_1262_cov_5.769163:505-1086(-)
MFRTMEAQALVRNIELHTPLPPSAPTLLLPTPPSSVPRAILWKDDEPASSPRARGERSGPLRTVEERVLAKGLAVNSDISGPFSGFDELLSRSHIVQDRVLGQSQEGTLGKNQDVSPSAFVLDAAWAAGKLSYADRAKTTRSWTSAITESNPDTPEPPLTAVSSEARSLSRSSVFWRSAFGSSPSSGSSLHQN